MKTGPKAQPTDARFWPKVLQQVNGCWTWIGARTGKGYGSFMVTPNRWAVAHVYSYLSLIGPIPRGMVLDHLCRNPLCVNPAHLEPVTQKENLRRGIGNGRQTHCPQGHEYSEANTRVDKTGSRHCRECCKLRERARRKRVSDHGNAHLMDLTEDK